MKVPKHDVVGILESIRDKAKRDSDACYAKSKIATNKYQKLMLRAKANAYLDIFNFVREKYQNWLGPVLPISDIESPQTDESHP